MSQQVIIFDTTLRDGEQALQASLSVKEKLQIALALERMGVDVMEVGFPVSSPGDFESVQTIARTIKKQPRLRPGALRRERYRCRGRILKNRRSVPYSYVYRHLADAHRHQAAQHPR
nr:2-isopropylmalate synthase [Raoultella sp. NCTC 9187]